MVLPHQRQLNRIFLSVPLVIFILLCITFGAMIPGLGFYWDDWETVLVGRLFSTSEYWTYFSTNRPLAAWTYSVFAPILGYKPFNWQLFTLILRWLSAWAFYRVLIAVWKNRRREAAGAAMLFAVYPVFTQQAIAMSYHHHWLQYLLFFITLEFMLYSVRYIIADSNSMSEAPEQESGQKILKLRSGRIPRTNKWLIVSGIVGGNLFMMFLNHGISEYFVTMEFIRPVLIYFVLREIFNQRAGRIDRGKMTQSQMAIRSLLYALPYLLFIIGFSAWRIIVGVSVPDSPNQMVLLKSLFVSPVSTLFQLTEMMLKDIVVIMASSWYPLLNADVVDLNNRTNLLSWLIFLICATTSAFFLFRLQASESAKEPGTPAANWFIPAALLGGLILLIGPLPVWITGKQASVGFFSNRFTLTSMMGASLLWVVGLTWLSRHWRQVSLVLAILIGLSCAFHFRTVNTYRYSWTRQQRFHWQLFWRAPSIQPNTILVGDGDILTYNRPIPSINVLYARPDENRKMAYWYYTVDDVNRALAEKSTFSENLRQFPFTGEPQNSLLVYYGPTNCLWVLNPEDVNHPELPQNLRELVGLIKLDRILASPHSLSYPPNDVFGSEPEHGWCYVYQKAELARQYFEWNRVYDLGELALRKNYFKSASPYEILPFVEGYARLGLWDQARQLTRLMTEKDPRYRSMYCNVFKKISGSLQVGEAQTQVQQISSEFNCSLPSAP